MILVENFFDCLPVFLRTEMRALCDFATETISSLAARSSWRSAMTRFDPLFVNLQIRTLFDFGEFLLLSLDVLINFCQFS